MDDIERLLLSVKKRTRGLMPIAVYRRLYESAAAAGGGTMVEIGTFCGAATIALALGARSSGLPFEIVTADLLRPGVGLEGAGPRGKGAALWDVLAGFGVADSVHFVHGSAEDLVAHAEPRGISLLLLDGGGRIESDFALLWERLAPGATIVVDDIDGRVTAERGLRTLRINQKHLLSKLLADIYEQSGLLIGEGRTESTGWYRKGEAARSADDIRLMALPAYHRLIHVELGEREFGLPRALLRSTAARLPGLKAFYRRISPSR